VGGPQGHEELMRFKESLRGVSKRKLNPKRRPYSDVVAAAIPDVFASSNL
jgi:hypothetical protein